MEYIKNLVVIASGKGGVGKTTTATNLYFEMNADLLINSDQGGTYEFTNYLRDLNNHKPINFRNVSSKAELKAILAENLDKKIIIDCAGLISEVAQAAMSIASIIITPISNSTKEIITLNNINKTLKSMSEKTSNFKKAFVLINRVATNRTDFSAFDHLSKSCEHLEVLNTVIRSRKSLIERTETQGLSVSESELQRVNAIKERQEEQQLRTQKRKDEGKTITLKKYKSPEISLAVNEYKSLAKEINQLLKGA